MYFCISLGGGRRLGIGPGAGGNPGKDQPGRRQKTLLQHGNTRLAEKDKLTAAEKTLVPSRP